MSWEAVLFPGWVMMSLSLEAEVAVFVEKSQR